MRRMLQSCCLTLAVLHSTSAVSLGQDSRPAAQPGANHITPHAGGAGGTADAKREMKSGAAPSESGAADAAEIADPLVRVLVTRGVISAVEGRAATAGHTPAEQRNRLASLLRDKGLISPSEYEAVRSAPLTHAAPAPAPAGSREAAAQNTQSQQAQSPAAQPKAPTPTGVVAAVAPLRLLQIDPPKREGLIPDIKLGSGARLKPYGFFKASLVQDSSSPGGNDFPLPLFLGDTGPSGSPEFHIKARAFRIGANFEWLDPAPQTVITGRVEFDFEGDFPRATNRSIPTIRSSQPSLRLAWARIDRALTEKTVGFALFGQDWTPFGSSTVPNTIETTVFHAGYGNIYGRAPQFRFGVNYNAGGARSLKFQPELALVLPAFGNTPSNVADQLGFGERQGADSNRPEFQGRFVTQFQLDRSPGVAPAQLVVSFTQARRRAIIRANDVPTTFRAAFPAGAEVESDRYGYTAEAQLPTDFVTLVAKYYSGADLRFYLGGQLFSTFNDTAGLEPVSIQQSTSIDSSSAILFGVRRIDGAAVVAPQRPVRGQGGFINLGFPLSRIFGADPRGRNAGWTGYLHYGYDQATARDARRFGGRAKSDVFMGSIHYRVNAFVTFALEESLFRTRAANNSRFDQGGLPLFRGIPARETHNLRSEFATIFTF